MPSQYDALVRRMSDYRNVNRALGLLGWDQQTYMPHGGAEARASQIATLSRIAHEILTADETGTLLSAAAAEVAGAAYDSTEASLIRLTQREFDKATRIPASLVAEMAEVTALAHSIWVTARKTNNFAHFAPSLERILDLQRRAAEAMGYEEQLYDAFLDDYEPGMRTSQVKAIFDAHRPDLVALISDIRERGIPVDDSPLHQDFPVEGQRKFGLEVAQAFGYDMERGRQDVAAHPFCITFSQGDVRITTRFDHNFLNPALFGTMHETGHALYEQGVSSMLEGTILSRGTSLGVHESQSRTWENLVGRSRAFWTWAYPQLQATFPDQLGSVTLEAFYRAINKVQPSLIRVEADEATYNLHIMLRFEIEMELVSGAIPLEKLPAVWNEKFEAYLGIVPPNDALGVLQDIHWSHGLIGYFPTYAIGNLLAAQYYRQAVLAHPSIPDEIARGQFSTLYGWMRDNIYRHGRKFTADELTQRAAGEAIECSYYIDGLRAKYSAIYGL